MLDVVWSDLFNARQAGSTLKAHAKRFRALADLKGVPEHVLAKLFCASLYVKAQLVLAALTLSLSHQRKGAEGRRTRLPLRSPLIDKYN